jgi:hypothetical protein
VRRLRRVLMTPADWRRKARLLALHDACGLHANATLSYHARDLQRGLGCERTQLIPKSGSIMTLRDRTELREASAAMLVLNAPVATWLSAERLELSCVVPSAAKATSASTSELCSVFLARVLKHQ